MSNLDKWVFYVFGMRFDEDDTVEEQLYWIYEVLKYYQVFAKLNDKQRILFFSLWFFERIDKLLVNS